MSIHFQNPKPNAMAGVSFLFTRLRNGLKWIPVSLLFVRVLCGQPSAFRIEPGTNVEVGEEVFFDASDFAVAQGLLTVHDDRRDLVFEWEYGDGYRMKPGFPNYWDDCTGITCVHFFMRPGDFTVVLTLTHTLTGAKAEASAVMHVSGEAPLAGFELWRAPFQGRTAQFIYAQIPLSVRQNASNRLSVVISGDNGHSEALIDKTGLGAEEKFLLRNALLPAGNYVLQAELLDASGGRLSLIREKFSKPYEGAPRVGIDEYNNIFIDGIPFFSVKPWQLNGENFPMWAGRFINTAMATGYYDLHSKANWLDYLNRCQSSGLYAIGPERYEGKGWVFGSWKNYRNTDIRKIEEYVDEFKNHPATLMWLWQDEPNLGPHDEWVPVQVTAAWTYQCHKRDFQHPFLNQYYGAHYLAYCGASRNDEYNYLYDAEYFGGKKHFSSDVINHDVYPVEDMNHPGMNYNNRGPFDCWAEGMDNLNARNGGLVPCFQSIESQDIFLDGEPPVNARQLRMMLWLCVAHGMKGLNFFQYFRPTPPENYGVMAEFLPQMTELTPVILGPDQEIRCTDNADSPGNRIDTFVRETDQDVFVIAVRLTEPPERAAVVPEPGEIQVTFNVAGLGSAANRAVDYFNKTEVVSESKGLAVQSKTFTFTVNEPPVAPGSVFVGGWHNDRRRPWMYSFDDGNGRLYYKLWEDIHQGTVNYQTGEITVTFAYPVPPGVDSMRVCYRPVRTDRTLPVNNGSFTDRFEREGVHIYRIAKNPAPPSVKAAVRVFLEGPYAAGSMNCGLKAGNHIPLQSPYEDVPPVTVASIPENVVDWVWIELRSAADEAVIGRSAFLRNDGRVVDLDGVGTEILFENAAEGDYYIAVKHKNHLSVMSAGPAHLAP